MVVGSVTEMTIWRITSLWPLREKNVHKNCEFRGGPCFRTSELMAHRGYLYIYWVIITQLLLCLIWTFTTGTEDIWQISLTFSDVCYQSKKHCPKLNSESGRVQSTPALSPAYNKQNHVFVSISEKSRSLPVSTRAGYHFRRLGSFQDFNRLLWGWLNNHGVSGEP